MLNPSPVVPPTSPKPPARPTRAYTTLFWFLVLGQVLATFTALMAVGTLLATARPVVRWRVARPPVVATTPTDTTGWQTYRNEELGFEVKYPSDRKLSINQKDENSLMVEFVSILDANFVIVASRVPLDDIEKWNTIVLKREIFLAGEKAIERQVRYSAGYGERYSVRFSHRGKYFEILSYETYIPQVKEKFDQFLSTFRFIEPTTDTTGWQTYRNEKLGVSFDYPSTWRLEQPADYIQLFNYSNDKYPGGGNFLAGDVKVEMRLLGVDPTNRSLREIVASLGGPSGQSYEDLQLNQNTVALRTQIPAGELGGGTPLWYVDVGDDVLGVAIYGSWELPEVNRIITSLHPIDGTATTDSWQTYEDKLYYFSDDDFYLYGFKYPGDGVRRQADKRIDFPVPAGTNLREKYVVVKAGLGANPRYQPQYCLAPAAVMIKSEYVSINDVDFIRQEWQEGAAGSQLEQTSYLLDTGHEGEFCIGVNFVFRSSNPEMFGDNPPPIFDREAEQQVIKGIMETFHYGFVSKAN